MRITVDVRRHSCFLQCASHHTTKIRSLTDLFHAFLHIHNDFLKYKQIWALLLVSTEIIIILLHYWPLTHYYSLLFCKNFTPKKKKKDSW